MRNAADDLSLALTLRLALAVVALGATTARPMAVARAQSPRRGTGTQTAQRATSPAPQASPSLRRPADAASPSLGPPVAPAAQPTSVPATQPASLPTTHPTSSSTSRPARSQADKVRHDEPTSSTQSALERVPYGYTAETALPAPSAPPGVRRPRPPYDGNAQRPTSLADALVWLPRTLLLPLYLTSEYLLRKPLVGLLTLAEKHYVFEWLKWLFVWKDDDVGIIPTFLVDFGLRPSVGFFFFYNDLFGPDQLSSVQFAFWGTTWVNLQLRQRFDLYRDGRSFFELRGGYLTRPDQPLYGIGAASSQRDELFYRPLIGQADAVFSGEIHQLNRFSAELRFRNADFKPGQDPSVDALLAGSERVGELSEVIPGFSEYNLLSLRLQLDLDTRPLDPLLTPGSGARLELFGSFNIDPGQPALNFFRWGTEGSLFWDFSGHNHVLGLRLYMEFLERTGDQVVPFYELPALGGNERMRGFFDRRFIGQSVVDATLAFRYPVWAILDGTVFVGLGNAFDRHLEGFALDKLFLNWGFGLGSSTDRYTSFEILIAFGSNRIDSEDLDPAATVRFVFGVNFGF
jgi:hypothetical protein